MYGMLYFIHLLCDVCTSLASLTRTFEREDVDLFIIERRVSAIITTLKRWRSPFYKPCLICSSCELMDWNKRRHCTCNQGCQEQFQRQLDLHMEKRMENYTLVDQVLNLVTVTQDSLIFYGEAAINSLPVHFSMDKDITLNQWSEWKELLDTSIKQTRLSDLFPNIYKLLSFCKL